MVNKKGRTMPKSTGQGQYGRRTTTRVKPKEIKTTGEPPEQVTVPTQEDINNANRTMLVHLAVKMDGFARREDMSQIELTVSEERPLRPVYPYEGGDPVGLMQKGPRKLVITILDHEHNGHVRACGEAW